MANLIVEDRKMKRVAIGLVFALVPILSVLADSRYLTITKLISGNAPIIINQNRQFKRAKLPQKLYQGSKVIVPEGDIAKIKVDIDQGSLEVIGKAEFTVLSLGYIGCGAITRIGLTQGQIYAFLREYTCPQSKLEIIDTSKSRTVNHVGTSFHVALSSDDRLITGVKDGKVVARTDRFIQVATDNEAVESLIGQPPRKEPVDNNMIQKDVAILHDINGNIKIYGTGAKTNIVRVNDIEAKTFCYSGNLRRWQVEVSNSKTLRLKVQNALGNTRGGVFNFRSRFFEMLAKS